MTTRAPIVLAAAVGLLALTGCNQYDQLIAKDQACDARWADYQAQLQRRSDLVPNLVATVKASAQHEEKTLSEVTEARARATGPRSPRRASSPRAARTPSPSPRDWGRGRTGVAAAPGSPPSGRHRPDPLR